MVPEFEHFILPVLKIVSDFGTITRADVRKLICDHFNFSEEEKKETTRSGQRTKYEDRCEWALTYLRQAKLISSPERAKYDITESGKQLLNSGIKLVTRDYLINNYPSFKEFALVRRRKKKGEKQSSSSKQTVYNIDEDQAKLDSLKAAIDAFRNAGSEPTEEQLKIVQELELKISKKKCQDIISALSILDPSLANNASIALKFCNNTIEIKVAYTTEPFDAFEGETCKSITSTEKNQKRTRRPNLNFYTMGLISGDTIHFKDDESIEATIVSESKVEYQGKKYSLTALTQELKNLDHAIQPTGEWLFDGRNLKDLYNENIS